MSGRLQDRKSSSDPEGRILPIVLKTAEEYDKIYHSICGGKSMINVKMREFIYVAEILNERLQIVPLLFGSLGLEQRLRVNLDADDIDILIPEVFLDERWSSIAAVMEENGYILYDLHEHAFKKSETSVAFASVESLTPFAGVDIAQIPVVEESGVRYYLLSSEDYLKVYTASSKDGYRKNVKNKKDEEKIELITKALGRNCPN